MLTIWIVSFLIGSLLGYSFQGAFLRLNPLDGYFIAAGAVVAWVCSRRRSWRPLIQTCVLAVAFLWGFVHHAPGFPPGSQKAHVIARSPGIDRTGPAIVRTQFGGFALIQQNTHQDLVWVRSWQSPGPFQSTFGWASQPIQHCTRHDLSLSHSLCMWRYRLTQTQNLHPLTSALILGDKDKLGQDVKAAFLATGTFHLLVVSGLHVTLIGAALYFTLNVIVRLLYALRILNAHFFVTSRFASFIFVLSLLFLYLNIIGLGPSAQRAFLLFGAAYPSSSLSLWSRMRLALFLQTAIFPLGWLGPSTLMSWVAYLLVVTFDRKRPLRGTLQLQLWLTILAAAVFQDFAGPGLFLNPLAAMIFPVVAICAGLDIGFDHFVIDAVLDFFLGVLTKIGTFAVSESPFTLYWPHLPAPIRWVLFLCVTPICLNALAKLSIRSEVSSGRISNVTDTMARAKRTHR